MPALKDTEWTYERIGDVISTITEAVETLEDTIKRSNLPAPVRAAMEAQIKQLEISRENVKKTRVEYYKLTLNGGTAKTLAECAVAPFRDVFAGHS